MDMKVYYGKIRAIEVQIPEADVVVVSMETPDGGRAGVRSEVPRSLAAKLLVEGRARLATEDEADSYREESRRAAEKAKAKAQANRLEVAIVSEPKARVSRKKKAEE